MAAINDKCDECGHIRYNGDQFNGLCATCEMWAEDQIAALRAEVARLQAKLARYEADLTRDEAERCWAIEQEAGHILTWEQRDRLIRQVRQEGMKP